MMLMLKIKNIYKKGKPLKYKLLFWGEKARKCSLKLFFLFQKLIYTFNLNDVFAFQSTVLLRRLILFKEGIGQSHSH